MHDLDDATVHDHSAENLAAFLLILLFLKFGGVLRSREK